MNFSNSSPPSTIEQPSNQEDTMTSNTLCQGPDSLSKHHSLSPGINIPHARTVNIAQKEKMGKNALEASCAEEFCIRGPPKPKRARTAYVLFMKESPFFTNIEHGELKITGKGDMMFGQMGRIAGRAFQALPQQHKNVYIKRSDEDKLRFDKEMREYNTLYLEFKKKYMEINTSVAEPKRRLREARARSAYNFFTMDESRKTTGVRFILT